MAKWKCILEKTNDDKVQNVGLRPFIISRLIDYGLERGDAKNLQDGKQVEIKFEAENKEQAQKICKNLEEDIISEAKSEYSKLPQNFKMKDVEEIQNPPVFELPKLDTKSNSLMLAQTSKGVGVMITIAEGIKSLPADLSKELKKHFKSREND